MKRGSVTKRNGARMVTVWMPHELADQLDIAIKLQDTDRSKLIRKAVRDKLTEINGSIEEAGVVLT